MKKAILAAMTSGALLVSAGASATFVNEWSYTGSLEWDTGSTVFTTGTGTQTNTSTLLSWGADGGDHTVSGLPAGQSRSGLEISNTPTNGTVDTNGADVDIGTVTHFNNAISGAFATLESGSLNFELLLTALDPMGDPLDPISQSFGFDFIETSNIDDCGFDSTSNCDDIFVITTDQFVQEFEYEGVTYTATLIDPDLNILSDSSCAQAGVAAGCVGIQTLESEFTPINLSLNIRAIPEPMTLALFGTGLLGLGALRRRKNQ
uniref:THxN family PEP-CTERM protein n=1 Tax=Thaumasiovibrio occultus TaxID=1891184 RepID=UPI000B35DB75|nr:THxN family PEP-CTERM protein [Thaumasiovibrio occultus]